MDKIKIQEIIPLTIQGEGAYMGTPCSFVRLYGCSVGCYFCDTGYADNATPQDGFKNLSLTEIAEQIKSDMVVITGGEPTINPGFIPLVECLIKRGHSVNIETSGTKWHPVLKKCWVTFSPKDHVSSQLSDPRFWSESSEVKIVISSENDYRFYKGAIFDVLSEEIPVYLQPEWSIEKDVLKFLIETANDIGAKISIQTHKHIGVR